ncbi:dihydroorotate dehydrogenase electron transfer subunit [Alteribacter keqinensis]|uniref:Dihydroorotate dehydrogenase B (NAD(+)), electron transfer subunit n=1 Tax=Alteribacter keqinensis TaxID=2483800 RepID=A0A3M7TXN7_9BACI|nr:dihydroorotate dehydrogenase electron transfer subunit [Alteribacter keqinensis]RNA69662.1 dihydroorotate dehydrogenase electron transfer subunit [Alteribacter keqinensis]
MKKVEKMTVVSHRSIAKNIYECSLSGELVELMARPGQFVHLRVSDNTIPTLRRPISICSVDHQKNAFTMVYRVEGIGTHALSQKRTGDQVDVLGPLGHGFPISGLKEKSHCLLTGGGIGVPPLYELAKQLTKQGHSVATVLGFRSKEDVFYEAEFSELGATYVATEDGTLGERGFVTDVIATNRLSGDRYYACGPRPMLRAIENNMTIPGFLSLEERMGCGVGACLACVCDVKNEEGYRKVCSDGPVFKAGEVVI